jgi:hypothetical protein
MLPRNDRRWEQVLSDSYNHATDSEFTNPRPLILFFVRTVLLEQLTTGGAPHPNRIKATPRRSAIKLGINIYRPVIFYYSCVQKG